MKQASFILILAFVFCVRAQTNFYANVTNLWYQGYKTNVLQIALQRLQSNTNDIAGWILKMECDVEFLDMPALSNSLQRVQTTGVTVTSPHFHALYAELFQETTLLLEMMKEYSPDELAADKAKIPIPNEPFGHRSVLDALQKDGYFDQ
jgi:hypothetical protein